MAIKALTFDVFGTVVDWRTAVIQELRQFGAAKGVDADWAAFTDAWKTTYRPAMDKVNAGQITWINVDKIFRDRLDELLPQYGLADATEEERERLNLSWCRPIAWPDSVAGIRRLKSRYLVSTLSNGNFVWLVNITKHVGLPFDCVLTAENAKAYKPDPRIYRTAIEMLGLSPGEILMVACHNYDLRAAKEQGLSTAFLPRKEHGLEQTFDQEPEDNWDFSVNDLCELAAVLGC